MGGMFIRRSGDDDKRSRYYGDGNTVDHPVVQKPKNAIPPVPLVEEHLIEKAFTHYEAEFNERTNPSQAYMNKIEQLSTNEEAKKQLAKSLILGVW